MARVCSFSLFSLEESEILTVEDAERVLDDELEEAEAMRLTRMLVGNN